MKDIQSLRSKFANPPSGYRPMPLWVWNDELRWTRLREQLIQFKNLGFGGVFVHPRPGLITEYLGKEWFGLWKRGLHLCKELGMECNIYDENSYPSGFAGGHVPSIAPETACQYVAMKVVPPNRRTNGQPLAVFRVKKKNGRIVSALDVSHLPVPRRAEGSPLMVFELRRASPSPWTGDFPYTDLTHPQTVKAFIATTHERYRKYFAREFGNTITASFTDEPLLATDLVYAAGTQPMLPLSYYTLVEFRKRYGYDLLTHLPSLFADVGDFRAVRFDYWQLLHDLWRENFLQPLGEWCGKHRLNLTGHYMEHEWPAPFITPDDMSLYACMQIPGIDLLLTTLLKPDRRYEGYSLINDDAHMLLTMRMLLSAVNQLGKPRALAEMWGAGGWDSTLEDYKRIADWALAHGINFFNPHLSYVTVRGARKRDHPQSFSDHSAWWQEMKGLNDRIARLSYALSQGEMKNRILVLQPTTSAFLFATPDEKAGKEFERMRTEHGTLVRVLCDHQIDFDLGDEYLLEECGRVRGKQLIIGRGRYDLVVIPSTMRNMRHQTVSLLERYQASGGRILALSSPPHWVDGREDESVRKLSLRYRSRWRRVRNLKHLVRIITKSLRPAVTFASSVPGYFSHHRRQLTDGSSLHFFFNGSSKIVRTSALIEGKAAEVWNADTGGIERLSFAQRKGKALEVPLRLHSTESLLLHILPSGDAHFSATQAVREKAEESLATSVLRVTPASLNVLVLNYCDGRYLGKIERGVNTWRANWNIWQTHGFERPAWDNAVQFRRRILERNQFNADTGFDATFRFDVGRGVDLRSLELAIECPEHYRVFVNGKRIDLSRGKRWMDPHIRSVSIARQARYGKNEVRLVGRPFDVRMELENIYIRGRFSLQPTNSGFRIAPDRPLRLGTWARQGFPFYSGLVRYETRVTIPHTDKRLVIRLPSWKGSSASVHVDGKRAGFIGWEPFELDLTKHVSTGEHTIRVTVAGTPKNLFGPFHDPHRSRNTAWPQMWSRFPEKGPPPGRRYDVEGYGLFRAPQLFLREW